ncbi:MAG: arylsulfotransferase family protein [Planctomycetota bacterium]|jgi:hypothetical protein
MLVDGKVMTAGEKTRLHEGVFGVTRYVPERCDPGYTLFSPAWGDVEYLVDMRGLLVHTWRVTHSNVGEILPSGNLFTHNCGVWLEELDAASETVWRWEGSDELAAPNHHDFCWVSEDHVVSLGARNGPPVKGLYVPGLEPEHSRNDVFMRINRAKEVIWELSLGDHAERLCELAGLPMPVSYFRRDERGEVAPRGPADWAHANTVEVLPRTPLGESDARFRAGNILFSLRALDTIGIIDPEQSEIVWAWGPGVLDGQHQPTMLPDGNILVFDNGTFRGHSIVREVEPASGEIVWQYEDGENFFSPFRAGNQRLPNGNTFICECDAGRLFEVTPEKEIVWEYWSPFVNQGPHHLGKRIHRATRYPPEAVEPILNARDDRIVAEVDREGRRIKSLRELIELYQS